MYLKFLHVLTYITIILFGLLGNGVVLVAVYRRPTLHCGHYYLIASMAVSDILLSVFVTSNVAISVVFDKWVFHPYFCTFMAAMTSSLCACTVLHLAAISDDRCRAITSPFKYKPHPSKGKLVKMFFFLWVLPFATGFLPLAGWSEFTYWPSVHFCVVNFSGTTSLELSYTIVVLLSFFVVPAFVMGHSHWKIFKVARRHRRQIAGQTRALENKQDSTTDERNSLPQRNYLKQRMVDLKPANMIIIVIAVFLFCYLPFWTVVLIRMFAPRLHALKVLLPLFCSLPLSNSAFNPAVYCYKNEEFRQEVLCIIRKRSSEISPQDQEISTISSYLRKQSVSAYQSEPPTRGNRSGFPAARGTSCDSPAVLSSDDTFSMSRSALPKGITIQVLEKIEEEPNMN